MVTKCAALLATGDMHDQVIMFKENPTSKIEFSAVDLSQRE